MTVGDAMVEIFEYQGKTILILAGVMLLILTAGACVIAGMNAWYLSDTKHERNRETMAALEIEKVKWQCRLAEAQRENDPPVEWTAVKKPGEPTP